MSRPDSFSVNALRERCAHAQRCSTLQAVTFGSMSAARTHMPAPEPRMLGKAEPDAQVSGKLLLMVLLFSARMVSLGKALFWPHAGGRVPVIWFPVSVSSLRKEARLSAEPHQTAVASVSPPLLAAKVPECPWQLVIVLEDCAAGVGICKICGACCNCARLLNGRPQMGALIQGRTSWLPRDCLHVLNESNRYRLSQRRVSIISR